MGTIYVATSCVWWLIFRYLRSFSSPRWLCFPLVFIAASVPPSRTRYLMMKIAFGVYVTASSSGSLFTALNFGDEGMYSSRGLSSMLIYMIGRAPVRSWIYRAALIQGTQQMLIAALFYGGRTAPSNSQAANATSTKLTAFALPISVLLWIIGIALFSSLSFYYYQRPDKVPAFYSALLRRPITC